MGKIVGFCNQKGGTGKTTSLVNIGSYFALAKKKTLVVDMDPQANATSGVGLDPNDVSLGSYDVLVGDVIPQKAIVSTSLRYLYVLPATAALAGAEIELISKEKREYQLREILQGIKENFDYILIDSPPSLGLLTLNVLTASDSILIPIQCEYYALEGLSRLLETIGLIKERLNPALDIEGIILTMADFRTRLTLQVIDEVKRHFPEKTFKTIIPRNIKLSESPSFGKPIYLYDKHCLGAKAYYNLTKEILKEEIKGVYDGEESIGQGIGCVDSQETASGVLESERSLGDTQRINLY